MPPLPMADRISYGPRWSPAVSGTARRLGSFRNPHPPQQIAKARVVPNAIKPWIHFDPRQPGRMFLVRLVEPLKRQTRGSEARINHRDIKRRDIVLRRSLLQVCKGLLRLASLPSHRVSMPEGPGHFGFTFRQRESLAKLRDGVLIPFLLLVRPPEV